MSELLDVDQLVARLRLSKPTVYRLTSQKRIPFVKIGQRVLFDPREIESWVKHQSIGLKVSDRGSER